MVVGVPARKARALKFMTVINISPGYPLGACDRRNETPVKSPNELLERWLIDVIEKRGSALLFLRRINDETLLVLRSARARETLAKVSLNNP